MSALDAFLKALLPISRAIDAMNAWLGRYLAWLILAAVLVANVVLNAARTHRVPIYRSVVQQNGRVLASKKYRLLGWAYRVLLAGLAAVVVPYLALWAGR